jgi:hypothetical protein
VTTSIRRSDLRSKHSLLSSIDVGRTFRVTVTASNSSGSATGTSAATAVVAATTSTSAPSLVSAPVISGTAQQGQTLSSSTGTWNGTQPISYSYQWYRRDSGGNNCAAGPTGQSYLLSSTDVGRTFRVTVTRVQLERVGDRHLRRHRGRCFPAARCRVDERDQHGLHDQWRVAGAVEGVQLRQLARQRRLQSGLARRRLRRNRQPRPEITSRAARPATPTNTANGAGWYQGTIYADGNGPFLSVDHRTTVRLRIVSTNGMSSHYNLPLWWPVSGKAPIEGEEDYFEGDGARRR